MPAASTTARAIQRAELPPCVPDAEPDPVEEPAGVADGTGAVTQVGVG